MVSNRLWSVYVPAFMLAAQAILLLFGACRNAVTIDEVCHLPAGISYWQRGEFWCYHHNPPLVRLLFSLPAVLMDTPIDYSHYEYIPGSRNADSLLGKEFMFLNQKNYMAIFVIARSVVAALTVLGGWAVFHFSRRVFGVTGANISLAMWAFDPNILAHGGLVTTDMGSVVIGFMATYAFWKYLQTPSLWLSMLSGVLLGCTIATKFSFVVLPFVWGGLAIIRFVIQEKPSVLNCRMAAGHGLLLTVFSLLALNDLYLCEGTGKPLGEFEFRSRGLTHEIHTERRDHRVNRFKSSVLARLPVPLPEHFVQGFDSQLSDVDSGGYWKYLRGEMRQGPGWWYYYLYCVAVKTPVGLLILCGMSVLASLASRRFRTNALTECVMILPIVVFTWTISANTGLNSHLRYALPVYPWVCLFAGRLGRVVDQVHGTLGMSIKAAGGVCFLTAFMGVIQVSPHYLTYFNGPAGGPQNGIKHLADSNIDWGQGLLEVKKWVDAHPQEVPVSLAYFGTMYPEVLGIEYQLPPFGLTAPSTSSQGQLRTGNDELHIAVGPVPGTHIVSANYLLGIPFPAPNANGGQSGVPLNGYAYFRRFEPVQVLGNSIYVFRLSPEEVNRVRREMGMIPLPAPTDSDGTRSDPPPIKPQ